MTDQHTTRPELRGSFGMVSSTHWIASQVGMSLLEAGGNAFDAAAAAGFALQVVEPHQNGPGGDLNLLFASPGDPAATVLCGQGTAPAGATIEAFADLGVEMVPGTGHLAPAIPGAFLAWIMLLRDRGTATLEQVLSPAAAYASNGYPATAKIVEYIERMASHFRKHWPSSAVVYLPDGRVPAPGTLIRNPALAATLARLIDIELRARRAGANREQALDAVAEAWREGFIAEAACEFGRAPVRDSTGRDHSALIGPEDFASWTPSYEAAVTMEYRGLTVCKPGLWSQGPVFLQQLAVLGEDPHPLDTPEGLHRAIEASKLAFADREAWYGDSSEVAVAELLAPDYTEARRRLLGEGASMQMRPGSPGGRTPVMPELRCPQGIDTTGASGVGEPNAVAALLDSGPRPNGESRSDTVHVDVVDRWGNMVAAMPSGGWLHAAPIIPALGFPLGTRLQMSWLEPGLPNSLTPGRRPRTTLSPSLALREGTPVLAFGSPGGDQQDQWALQFFLRVVAEGRNLQAAIDEPAFHSTHAPSSFFPHDRQPGVVVMERRFDPGVVDALRRSGHLVGVSGPWEIGRLCAVGRDLDRDGQLLGAANSRGMQGYAVGR